MKQTVSTKQMAFEQWMDLAMNDPEQFEVMRRAAIDEFLASIPAEKRLHLQRLQWRVDRVRERCANPMAATIAISEMMWDAFYNLHDQYQDIIGNTKAKRYTRPLTSAKSAKVLPFQTPVTT